MDTATETEIEQRFQVGGQPVLELDNVAGDIVIRAGQDGAIVVRAEKYGSRQSMERTQVEMEQQGDRVSVRTRHDPGQFGLQLLRGMSLASVRYRVEVPKGCAVRVKGVSSSIEVSGTGADANVSSVSGGIRISDGAGDLNLTTVSGSIAAENLDGAATIRSTSGKIDVGSSRLDAFNINTVSGRIRVETPLTTGRQYTVGTVSGSVVVEVPPETAATVTLRSVSGDASFDLPAQVIKSGRRSWQGILNGGGATLEVHSVSGSLRVTRGRGDAPSNGDVAPERETAQTPKHSEADRLEILRRLQQGEITLEQAMKDLE